MPERLSNPEEITALIRPDFLSSYSEEAVLKTVRTCKASIWSKDNVITQESYARLIGIMQGRQITPQEAEQVPYDAMVDMSFVKTAKGAA